MEIFVIGLNHKTAPLEIREKLSIPAHKTEEIMKVLEERKIFDERLLLSTCNRSEIYVHGEGTTDLRERLMSALSKAATRCAQFMVVDEDLILQPHESHPV